MSYGKPKKVASVSVLKTGVGQMVTEGGEIRRDDRQKIYIEKAGKLRMFAELPPYVGVLLPNYKLEDKFGRNGVEWVAADNRVYGRDPDSIEAALYAVNRAYSERKKSLVLEPKILVRFKGENTNNVGFGSNAFSYGKQQVALELSVARMLFEPETSKPSMMSGTSRYARGTFYVWREDLDTPLERTSNYGSGDLRVFDYSDELWARVCSMRDAFATGVERFRELMTDDTLEAKLLSGNVPLQLAAPE